MTKPFSFVRFKPGGVFTLQHRGIVHPQHPGKSMNYKPNSLQEGGAKPPLGTNAYQGDPEIFYDFGNVPNGFIEGKLAPLPYSDAVSVAKIGESDDYNSEQCEG